MELPRTSSSTRSTQERSPCQSRTPSSIMDKTPPYPCRYCDVQHCGRIAAAPTPFSDCDPFVKMVVVWSDLVLIDNQTLSRKYQYVKRVREDLRERFRIEYFGFLRQETRRLKTTIPFKVGDMVLIGQESLKRLHWPLARIIKLYPGKDGLVRVAKLRTAHQETQPIGSTEPFLSMFESSRRQLKVEEEIVSLGKSMGLEVEERDVNELIEEHTQELTTEELQELQSQQHTEVMQVIGFEESEEEVISTSEIKEILGMSRNVGGVTLAPSPAHHPLNGRQNAHQGQGPAQ
ncbi:hypothetical protein LAZ67_20001685 [Cordylochernes scorpioides]|uniref:DUF5641 domain-containing protein n=1 Tax=Cordylochernes scorpioides TaxID=51811 RepID=A0ABY6LMJ2_9ARAC|nr:hypothetical protein LAZ67_20001685 [Cordylochernes scorpioides]